MANIIEGIQEECDRVRKVMEIYKTVPMGHLAASLMAESIKQAERAIASGDTVGMVLIYKDLKGYTL